MNSDVVATMREGLELLRNQVAETEPINNNLRGRKNAKLARINAALLALEEAAGWEDVPNGDYVANSRGATFTVDGEWLTTRELALDGNTYHATIKLPKNVRLRKRQPAQEGD